MVEPYEQEQQITAEQLRQMKQNYLVENVVNEGYDTEKFGTFMNYKKGKQSNSI